jgi:hypothetical protein
MNRPMERRQVRLAGEPRRRGRHLQRGVGAQRAVQQREVALPEGRDVLVEYRRRRGPASASGSGLWPPGTDGSIRRPGSFSAVRQALVAMPYSQTRTEERPSNRS